MNIQEYIDAMLEHKRDARSNYHLTLGELIERLEAEPQSLQVVTSNALKVKAEAHSYRGYYSDLAIEPDGLNGPSARDSCSIAELLDALKGILDTVLIGYKGGEFLMAADTPLWVSGYGTSSGFAVVDSEVKDDKFVLRIKVTD